MRRACVAAGWGIVAAIVWLSLTPAPPRVEVAYGDKADMLVNAIGVLLGWGVALLLPKPLLR